VRPRHLSIALVLAPALLALGCGRFATDPGPAAGGAGGGATTGSGAVTSSTTTSSSAPSTGSTTGTTTSPSLCAWSQSFGDVHDQDVTDSAIDPSGALVIAGAFRGALLMGQDVLDSGYEDDNLVVGGKAFVAKLAPDGTVLWARVFGAAEQGRVTHVAVDAAGSVFVTTTSSAPSIDLGTGPIPVTGSSDVVLAKLDPSGKTLWSRRALDDGDPSHGQFDESLATDAAGNLFIYGFASTEAHRSLVLAKLDPSGEPLWTRAWVADQGFLFGALDKALAVDGAGAAYFTIGVASDAAAGAHDTFDLGSGTLTVEASTHNGIVAKVDAAGHPVWNRLTAIAPTPENTMIPQIAVAATEAGEVYVASSFLGTVDVGKGPMTATANGSAYVAKLDASGATAWARSFGDGAFGVVAAAPGRVVVAGGFNGFVDLAGERVDDTDGAPDLFIGALDAADGSPVYAHAFTGGGAAGWQVAVDGAGAVLVSGTLVGSVGFCDQTLETAGLRDFLVAKLSP
jgi:hypothetical protein